MCFTLDEGTGGGGGGACGSVEQLTGTLDALATARPPEQFVGQYTLLKERITGGQAVVNFARNDSDATGGFMQYAIKFFFERDEYDDEVGLYRDATLAATLPDLLRYESNDGGALRAPAAHGGYQWPPFIVLERGITLGDWCALGGGRERGFGEILTMVEALTRLLAILHGSGRVHRDLKPANVLYLLQSTEWRLLDLGIVGQIGATEAPRCTLGYASPEVVMAVWQGTDVLLSAAADIWAVGVMAYEAVVQHPAMETMEQVLECASGQRSYPWELPPNQQPKAWKRSKLRNQLSPCLMRDPAQRPSANAMLQKITSLGQATTMGAATMRAQGLQAV